MMYATQQRKATKHRSTHNETGLTLTTQKGSIKADVGQANNHQRMSNTVMHQSTCLTRNNEMFDVQIQLTIKQLAI